MKLKSFILTLTIFLSTGAFSQQISNIHFEQAKQENTHQFRYQKLTYSVGIESLRINGNPQDPETKFNYSVSGEWENWRIR